MMKEWYFSIGAVMYSVVLKPLLRGLRECILHCAKISKNDIVLDVACGTGDQALLFAKRGAIVTGVDLSEEMIAVAKRETRNFPVTLLQCDATRLPFKNNTFHVSTCTLTLHSLNPHAREKVLKEMKRVTKKNGRIIIGDYTIPRSKSITTVVDRLIFWSIERFLTDKEHHKNYKLFMTLGGIHSFVKKQHLAIERSHSMYGDNFGILQCKK